MIDFFVLVGSGVANLWGWAQKYSPAIVGFFTIGIFVVTFLLARYTKKLWRSTNDLVDRTEKSSKIELRAYVSVVSATIETTNTSERRPGKLISHKDGNDAS